MQILDLRPRSVRLISHLWGQGTALRGRQIDRPGSPHLPARVAAGVADRFISRLVAGRRLVEPGPAIVSVGNLALGGTGKTPVVAALAGDLASAGWRGAILTRGFGSSLAGPLTVEPDNDLAGDEARVMAGALADSRWPVVQARKRVRGLEHLLQEYPATQVVIVEDGHQTARLGRHLDVVILDGWTVTGNEGREKVGPVTGPVFPFGPWRESIAGADRAGIWLLETKEELPAEGVGGQAVCRFQRSLSLRGPEVSCRNQTTDGRAAVLSGIARPEAFEQALGEVLTGRPVLAVRCGDHAQYSPGSVKRITQAARQAAADFIVTTGKDWVKLKPLWPAGFPVLVADLTISWGNEQTLPALVGERLENYRRL